MSSAYYLKNREAIIQKNSNQHKKRKEEDIDYKLRYYVRNRIYLSLLAGGVKKSKGLIELVGCSIPELKEHLAHRFQSGMSWLNYGEWHVDHIRPCASFDLTIESNQKECFHYLNLQPLWAKDNQKKNAKYQ